jgi:uncharacterized protein (DUF697 family)
VTAKEEQSLKIVARYMWWSMGAGLVPLPIADLVAVSGVQLKMLAGISKIYEIAFPVSRGKAAIGSLLGFVFPHAMSTGRMSSVIKAIPVVGILAGTPSMVLFSGAYTWALGNVFIRHFESGGTLLNFRTEEVRHYFRAKFEEGRRMAGVAAGKGSRDLGSQKRSA